MFTVSTHSRKYVLSNTARIFVRITALLAFLSVSVPGQVITKSYHAARCLSQMLFPCVEGGPCATWG